MPISSFSLSSSAHLYGGLKAGSIFSKCGSILARSSGLMSFSGHMILRAQGLLTLMRSQTLISPARRRLIMVGSLVSDSALTFAPLDARNGSRTWAELYPSQHRMFSSLERSAMALRKPSVPPAANAEAQSADCCMKFRRDSFDVNMVPLPIGRVTESGTTSRYSVPGYASPDLLRRHFTALAACEQAEPMVPPTPSLGPHGQVILTSAAGILTGFPRHLSGAGEVHPAAHQCLALGAGEARAELAVEIGQQPWLIGRFRHDHQVLAHGKVWLRSVWRTARGVRRPAPLPR